jgi:hypothetical protein
MHRAVAPRPTSRLTFAEAPATRGAINLGSPVLGPGGTVRMRPGPSRWREFGLRRCPRRPPRSSTSASATQPTPCPADAESPSGPACDCFEDHRPVHSRTMSSRTTILRPSIRTTALHGIVCFSFTRREDRGPMLIPRCSSQPRLPTKSAATRSEEDTGSTRTSWHEPRSRPLCVTTLRPMSDVSVLTSRLLADD